MAAPYYQMRGQLTNIANAQFAQDDVEQYDLSASVTPPHDAALYTDHQSSETPVASLEENHNFVELLEAATTAAARQAAQAMNFDGAAVSGWGKRKRVSSSPVGETSTSQRQGNVTSGPKRTRTDAPTDPQLHGAEGIERNRSEGSSVPPTNESLLNDVHRAAGVHSAAALFRRSSEKTPRKYTRPPMSKLFMSLQLTPENFLHLQAQAKSYMLDPAHPDRQSCVGNRGKGDTDMVKLRLFNCARDFLNNGVGGQFFGENVEKPGENDAIDAARALGQEKAPGDQLLWPRDANKIISLVTPLLRRMVTNERQRMYAIETRKGGAKKKEASVEAAPVPSNNTQGMSAHGLGQHVDSQQAPNPPPQLQSLAPIRPSRSQLYLTSPVLSLPLQSSNMNQDITTEFEMVFREFKVYKQASRRRFMLPSGLQLELPMEPQAEPMLDFLNIFVAKVIPPRRGNPTPTPVLLQAEVRLEDSQEAPLFHMTWAELQRHVASLVKETVLRYPELEPKEEPLVPEVIVTGMGPEALRGLAVAATQVQNGTASESANKQPIEHNDSATVENPFADTQTTESSSATTPTTASPVTQGPAAIAPSAASPTPASPQSPTGQKRVTFAEPPPRSSDSSLDTNSSTRGLAPSSPRLAPERTIPASMQPPSTVLREASLPKFKLESQWTNGLRDIAGEDDWGMVKLDVAYAIWADRVMNVVVTIL
ncbi:hypothetical protein K458DRAFT_473545 [Lentithecium fluviatile CBS 122367]|uniref:Uncharacterized protein n=1 Tax=Lentithecium fluviatile CBS 122367 TaxID=1168545 RepID=A0A6G1JMS3_9PLEO|nr:hypothetical protein K458DRAFT_473545 [Lentithecium fluviatile CBS 122367]